VAQRAREALKSRVVFDVGAEPVAQPAGKGGAGGVGAG